MKLFLSSVLLTLVFQGVLVAQERPAFRVIPIPNRENGYGNFESIAINTKAEFDSFLAATSQQPGWNSRQAFADALQNANIDFTREALVLLRHSEGSGSVRVTFETPTLLDRKLVCQIRGKALTGGGTMDMAYYCFAVVVSRSLVSEVELRAVVGGFKERELPPIVFPIRAQRANEQSAKPNERADPNANNKEETIARLFGIVNELKSEPDAPAAALLQSEVADVLWRFDEPGARVIFRAAFDSARQMKTDTPSSLDAEAKSRALREGRRRANALKTILKRFGMHDRKGAENWLQDFENELQAEQKNSNRSSRMSLEQAELLAEIGAGLVGQDAREAQRLGALSLTAESIPMGFTRLLMALRGVDKSLSDMLFRQALSVMRANGLRYDFTIGTLANYEFFANGRPVPDATSGDVDLLTQYFVDAAGAQLARLQGGALNSDEQVSLGQIYNFLNGRALPIVALNSPTKLTLLQSNLAEIARGLTVEQRRQADTFDSLMRQPERTEDNDADVDARIHRIEQEKNADTRDVLFRNLAVQLMRGQPEKALDVARRIDDLELRAQSEDDIYLVMLEDAFRSDSSEKAKSLALKINDKATGARWLAEIAVKRSRSNPKAIDGAAATALLSEAYTIAMKSDNDGARVDALLYIAQQFLQFDRDRGFEILSEALKTANRVDPKPALVKAKPPTTRIITTTVVNGKERSTALRPTLQSTYFNEVADFVKTDYSQTMGLGDSLKDHLLRSKYFIAIGRSILGVPREGPAYELTWDDILRPD